MPQHVQAPDGSIVEFPDNTPVSVMEKAMREAYPAPASDLNLGQDWNAISSGFGKGLHGSELGIRAIARLTAGDLSPDKSPMQADLERQYAEAQAGMPKNPTFLQNIAGSVAGGFGNIAAGAFDPVTGFAGQSAQEKIEEARRLGITDPDKIRAAVLQNAAIGGGVGAAFEGLGPLAEQFNPFAKGLAHLAGETGIHSAGAGVLGGAQQFGGNVVTQQNFNPNQNLMEGVPESALSMAALGGLSHLGGKAVEKGAEAVGGLFGKKPVKPVVPPIEPPPVEPVDPNMVSQTIYTEGAAPHPDPNHPSNILPNWHELPAGMQQEMLQNYEATKPAGVPPEAPQETTETPPTSGEPSPQPASPEPTVPTPEPTEAQPTGKPPEAPPTAQELSPQAPSASQSPVVDVPQGEGVPTPGRSEVVSGGEAPVAGSITETSPPVSPLKDGAGKIADGQGPSLPENLSKSQPRFGRGSDNFTPQFDSDVDKALFITAQRTKSAADGDFRAWLKSLGYTDEQIQTEGIKVRKAIADQVRTVTGGGDIKVGRIAENPEGPRGAIEPGAKGASVGVDPGELMAKTDDPTRPQARRDEAGDWHVEWLNPETGSYTRDYHDMAGEEIRSKRQAEAHAKVLDQMLDETYADHSHDGYDNLQPRTPENILRDAGFPEEEIDRHQQGYEDFDQHAALAEKGWMFNPYTDEFEPASHELVQELKDKGNRNYPAAERQLQRAIENGQVKTPDPSVRIGGAPETYASSKKIDNGWIRNELDVRNLEDAIKGKKAHEIAGLIAKRNPNSALGVVAKAVERILKAHDKAGIEHRVTVVNPGHVFDPDPDINDLYNQTLKTATAFNGNLVERGGEGGHGTETILKGSGYGNRSAMGDEVILHELIHAITRHIINASKNGDARLSPAEKNFYKELQRIRKVVLDYKNMREKAILDGKIKSTKEDDIFLDHNGKKSHNAFENEHELVSWALTDKSFQKWLEGVKDPNSPIRNMFNTFVGSIRELLGLPAQSSTALSSILHTTNDILHTDINKIKDQTAVVDPNVHFAKTNTDYKSVDTESSEFKNWFGLSRAVDRRTGEPRKYYTGTSKDTDFSKFKVPRNGTWFISDPKEASSYALQNDSMDLKPIPGTWKFEKVNQSSRVMPVYIKAENPYIVRGSDVHDLQSKIYDRGGENYKRGQSIFFDELRARGFDSVIIQGHPSEPETIVVLGDSGQVKSAISNTGEYSRLGPINAARTNDDTAPEIHEAINNGAATPEQIKSGELKATSILGDVHMARTNSTNGSYAGSNSVSTGKISEMILRRAMMPVWQIEKGVLARSAKFLTKFGVSHEALEMARKYGVILGSDKLAPLAILQKNVLENGKVKMVDENTPLVASDLAPQTIQARVEAFRQGARKELTKRMNSLAPYANAKVEALAKHLESLGIADNVVRNYQGLKKGGIQTLSEAYAYAMHAEEANKYGLDVLKKEIGTDAQGNPIYDPATSGMTDAEAKAIKDWVANLPIHQREAIEAAHSQMKFIVEQRERQAIQDGIMPDWKKIKAGLSAQMPGLEAKFKAEKDPFKKSTLKAQLDSVKKQINKIPSYENYVPLKSDEDSIERDAFGNPVDPANWGGFSGGGGQSVKGKEDMSRLGRSSYAGQITNNILNDYESSQTRGVRNLAGQKLMQLIKDGHDAGDEYIIAHFDKPSSIQPTAFKKEDGSVGYSVADYRNQPNAFITKVNGKEVYARIKTPDMMASINGFDGTTGRFMKMVGGFDQGFSNMGIIQSFGRAFHLLNAGLSVPFAARLIIKHTDVAKLNATGLGKGLGVTDATLRKGISDHTLQVGRAFLAESPLGKKLGFTADPQVMADLKELRANGGLFKPVDLGGIENIQDNLDNIFAPENWKDKSPRERWLAFKSNVHKLEQTMSSFTNHVEWTTRLAVYRTMKDHGASPKEAAWYAQELTGNFGRKGLATRTLSTLYPFYNAGVQADNASMSSLIKAGGGAVAKSAAGLAAIGAGIALYNYWMGDMYRDNAGPDGKPGNNPYSLMPSYKRAGTSLAIQVPFMSQKDGSPYYLKAPEPFKLFSLPINAGAASVAIMHGDLTPGEFAMDMVTEMFSGAAHYSSTPTANPLVSATPGIARIPVALGVNKSELGAPIHPEFPTRSQKAPSQVYTKHASDMSIGLADLLHKGGLGEVYPDDMDYIAANVAGSAGSFVMGLANTAMAAIPGHNNSRTLKGQDKFDPITDNPVSGIFMGRLTSGDVANSYYMSVKDVKEYKERYKEFMDSDDHIGAQQFKAAHPKESSMVSYFNRVESEIKGNHHQLKLLKDNNKLSVQDKISRAEHLNQASELAQRQFIYRWHNNGKYPDLSQTRAQ